MSAAPVLDGSEYQKRWFGGPEGPPGGAHTRTWIWTRKWRCSGVLQEAIAARLLRSAHDCSDGGLAVALAESCIAGGVGADLAFHRLHWMAERAARPDLAARPDIAFFGETPTLVVVSVAAADGARLEELCHEAGVPCHRLGRVGGDGPGDERRGPRRPRGRPARAGRRLEEVYETALPRAMGE